MSRFNKLVAPHFSVLFSKKAVVFTICWICLTQKQKTLLNIRLAAYAQTFWSNGGITQRRAVCSVLLHLVMQTWTECLKNQIKTKPILKIYCIDRCDNPLSKGNGCGELKSLEQDGWLQSGWQQDSPSEGLCSNILSTAIEYLNYTQSTEQFKQW